MPLIVTKPNTKATRLDREPVVEERKLQEYIADNPECLPLDHIEEDLRLLVLAREFPTLTGPIDALGIDQEGGLYIIETKLYKGADKRRVLAQVLDYGASLWREYKGNDQFISRLARFTEQKFKKGLHETIREVFDLDTERSTQVLENLKGNIGLGRFRFIVLMDHVDDRLKALVEFVNASSRFEIFAVELEFYKLEESTIVVPRLWGSEKESSEPGAAGRSPRGDEFFEQAEKLLARQFLSALRRLYDFSSTEATRVGWGRGNTGSFSPRYDSIGQKSLYTVYSDGRLILNFRWIGRTDAGRDAVKLLGEGVKDIGLTLPHDYPQRFVRFEPEAWAPRLEQLEKIIRGVKHTMESRREVGTEKEIP